MDIEDLRKQYRSNPLEIEDLDLDPFKQFKTWFEEAIASSIPEPNAMSLATVSTEGRPSCRTVLMKGFSKEGILFYTNYRSRKAREIDEKPYAAITFLWKELERQVTMEGRIEKTSREESCRYFAKRPRGSQIGAWASPQDEEIPSREALESNFRDIEHRFSSGDVPTPHFWGGFRFHPSRFEFWQGRENRLHDRFYYQFDGYNWQIRRLAP